MKKRYALLLANSEHRENKLAHLPLPGEGWEAFSLWLRDPLGGNFQGVEVVSGATLAQTMLAIDRFFSNKSKDDTLLLWFGGHAIVDAQGETFLCLRDSDRLRLKSTAIMAGVLAMHMDAATTAEKLLILDCRFHAFASQKQDAEMRPVLRPERAFVGRGNAKHILLAEPALHLHTHIEAESATRAISPFTRALTAIWREQNEELQGLTLGDLYPSLCRRLGLSGKPEWHKVGDAQDVVLAPAARTEMVTAMNSGDPERNPRDLDSLDWDMMSGEIPLDILGLGLGHAGRTGKGDTAGRNSGSGGGGSGGDGRDGTGKEQGPNSPIENPEVEKPDPNQTGSFMVDELGMPTTSPSKPVTRPAPIRLHPEDLLNATQSMLSPEALEMMGDANESKPEMKPVTEPLDGLPTVLVPNAFSTDEKMRRALEAEAERERLEAQSQEEEVRRQAEALKRWKEQQVQAQAQPQPTLAPIDLTPIDLLPIDLSQPTRSQPATGTWMPPEVQQTQMIDAESAEALREAATAQERRPDWRRPESRPADFNRPDSNRPMMPSDDPAFAATRMYVVEDPTDLNATPIGLEPTHEASPRVQAVQAPIESAQAQPWVPPHTPAVDGRRTGTFSNFDAAHVEQAAQPQAYATAQGMEEPQTDRYTLERAAQGRFDYSSEGGLYAPAERPWKKIALIAVSMLVPLIAAGILLHMSGLFDRLTGNAQATVLTPDGQPYSPDVPDQSNVSAEVIEPTVVEPPPQASPANTKGQASAQAQPVMPKPVKVPAKSMAPPSAAKSAELRPQTSPEDEIIHRNLKVALQRQMQKELPHLTALFDRYVLAYPDLQGIVNLRLEVGGDGRIRSSKCVSSTTTLPSFDEDVARIALGWRLAGFSSPRPKYVTLPLRFPLNTP
jgi:hypothetical protein